MFCGLKWYRSKLTFFVWHIFFNRILTKDNLFDVFWLILILIVRLIVVVMKIKTIYSLNATYLDDFDL